MTDFGKMVSSFTLFGLIATNLFSPISLANSRSDPASEWIRMNKARIEKQLGTNPESRLTILSAEEVCQKWSGVQYASRFEYEKSFQYFFASVIEVLPSLYKERSLTLGALSINEMFDRLQKVRVFTDFHSSQPTQADVHRKTDFYIPECSIGVLNKQYLFLTIEGRKRILVHVFLGAAGYADNDFQLTNALLTAEKQLSNSRSHHQIDLSSLFPQNKEDLYWRPIAQPFPTMTYDSPRQILIAKRGGGYTGAGGGGDGSVSLVKDILRNYTPEQINYYTETANLPCQQAWSNYATYLRDIQDLKIETNSVERFLFSKRREIGSYWIRTLPTVYGEENTAAVYTAVDILGDYCKSRYGVR